MPPNMAPLPYPSPLAGYENALPLPSGLTTDGKSLDNYIARHMTNLSTLLITREMGSISMVCPPSHYAFGQIIRAPSSSLLHAYCLNSLGVRAEIARKDSQRIS
ncbi:hypothetical protein BT96DRAFT_367163 [Gymnopus androsaceus JB14]|uniref:Uncharacterized protein n=1 Tax=Gymnopus androsaceus JB14 TaxID=1447944 RepID=A0A6A4IKY5_9AGAR|nr:hypothetical protein BT96DRAFT_367163 [Gymnopus androsaceus JB14]